MMNQTSGTCHPKKWGGGGGGCPQCIASGVLFAYNFCVKREEVKKRTENRVLVSQGLFMIS